VFPPRRRSASPPEGAAPGGFPLGTPPCRGRREKLAWLLPTFNFCAPAFSRPLTRSASLAAYVARPPVAQRPRTPRAFLRRFKPTAQIRSHAGCALGGDRLAFGVCGRRMRWVVSDTANNRMQHTLVYERVLPLTPVRGAVCNNHRQCLSTHGCCEAVAAERAGGERGFLFATQKAENRVPPSIKAASSAAAATMRLPLNAGRAK